MFKIRKISGLLLLTFLLCLTPGQVGLADGPYYPLHDTITDINAPDYIFGLDYYLQLNASYTQESGCVPSSYIWFKFLVPSTSVTISTARLVLPLDYIDPGTELLPMELLASADTDWDEATLMWDIQPALDLTTGVLATSPSIEPPNDVQFMGPTFAGYLDEKKGQLVTLVVRADCNQPVAFLADRLIASKENSDPNALHVELGLQSPSNIALTSFLAEGSQEPGFSVILVGITGLLLAACFYLEHRFVRRR